MAPTIKAKTTPMNPTCFFLVYPQCGHAFASLLCVFPHSLQVISAMRHCVPGGGFFLRRSISSLADHFANNASGTVSNQSFLIASSTICLM